MDCVPLCQTGDCLSRHSGGGFRENGGERAVGAQRYRSAAYRTAGVWPGGANAQAPNIAREIVLGTGMSVHTDAYSVSRACATSFQAIANVAESIMAGTSASASPAGGLFFRLADWRQQGVGAHVGGRQQGAHAVAASQAVQPAEIPRSDAGAACGGGVFHRAAHGRYRRADGEDHGITREAQDALAHRSHELAAKAWQQGWLRDEVMTAYVPPYRAQLSEDNNIRKTPAWRPTPS